MDKCLFAYILHIASAPKKRDLILSHIQSLWIFFFDQKTSGNQKIFTELYDYKQKKEKSTKDPMVSHCVEILEGAMLSDTLGTSCCHHLSGPHLLCPLRERLNSVLVLKKQYKIHPRKQSEIEIESTEMSISYPAVRKED